jgi:hypothetical protein
MKGTCYHVFFRTFVNNNVQVEDNSEDNMEAYVVDIDLFRKKTNTPSTKYTLSMHALIAIV